MKAILWRGCLSPDHIPLIPTFYGITIKQLEVSPNPAVRSYYLNAAESFRLNTGMVSPQPSLSERKKKKKKKKKRGKGEGYKCDVECFGLNCIKFVVMDAGRDSV
jgi:hypothetical protein